MSAVTQTDPGFAFAGLDTPEAPTQETELLNWMAARLREAYPNHPPDQIKPGVHAVTISFSGSGLDVDVAPVLWEGEPDDVGYLIEDAAFSHTFVPSANTTLIFLPLGVVNVLNSSRAGSFLTALLFVAS